MDPDRRALKRQTSTRHRGAAILALLVLVPLLHGAGAHLTAVATEGITAAAPGSVDGVHATDEVCALCTATRHSSEIATAPSHAAIASPAEPIVPAWAHAPAVVPTAQRPDAARAPPLS